MPNEYVLNGNYQHMWGNMLHCSFAMTTPYNIKLFKNEQQADLHRFIRQVEWANSIFFEGGETLLLLQRLRLAGDWFTGLQDKTIVAVSAGISAIMTASFNVDHKFIVKGLGLLPFTSVVHYWNDMEWMIHELKREYPSLPALAIPDGSFTIIHY